MSSTDVTSLSKKVEGIRLRILALQDLQPSASASTFTDWKKEFAKVLVSINLGFLTVYLTSLLQNLSHKFIDECVSTGVRIKIPRLVLSAWSEWADARKSEAKVDPSRVNDFDHRVVQHSWHDEDEETPPTSPTEATTDILNNYHGKSLFLIRIILY